MPSKEIELPDVGRIKLVKSKQNRNLRLSVTATGVRVSMPQWMPYSAGKAYALKNSTWIQHHVAKIPSKRTIMPGDRIGRLHTVEFVIVDPSQKPQVRVSNSRLLVQHHAKEPIFSTAVQTRATRGSQKVLKKEADLVLPQRLDTLAKTHGFTYQSVQTKQLKRRWGSCDNKRQIVLNYYLMELPWDCIDYVLLHELTHTIHLNHSPEFWAHMHTIFPRVDDVRKQLRDYQPVLRST